MANILHRIKAYLYKNLLTDDPNDFIARVISERSLGTEQVCESAVNRGGADISVAAMKHAVELWLKEMGYLLCDGFSINTGYFTVIVHIKGIFKSPIDHYDPKRHTIAFQFNQGDLLRKELPSIEVQILGVADSSASIAQVIDVRTGSVDDRLTPGRNLKIAGTKIKIAGDRDGIGVYFVNTDTGDSIRVDPMDIVVNNPSEVIVVIPSLAKGKYRVEIASQFTGNVFLKDVRFIVFEKLLTVE